MKKQKILLWVCICLFICISLMPILSYADRNNQILDNSDVQEGLSNKQIQNIESFTDKLMKKGKIPGISVTIVKGDNTIYQKGFGYADLKAKSLITPQTHFELGSNSKAFTALGILLLEKDGLIKLSDPVQKYLPWFNVNYKGEYKGEKINRNVDITLEQLLHHSSGIPFNSIGDIPVSSEDDALENTVRKLIGRNLDFYPGERYLYATINYDVLGLVLEKVTGTSFEEYIKNNVLEPLGLRSTYLFRQEVRPGDMATGYKVGFLKPLEYAAPMYRGNTPAGYFISNPSDMAKWLKIQLDFIGENSSFKEIIRKSHMPDRKVEPGVDGASYACGWLVYQDGGGEISHAGGNPNFSSFVVFRPEEQLGVVVLANLDSAFTQPIGQGIMEILQGNTPEAPPSNSDIYINLDNQSFTVILIAIPLILLTLIFIILQLVNICRRKIRFKGNVAKTILFCTGLVVVIGGFAYCLYLIPKILFSGLPWTFVRVWGPLSLTAAVGSLLVIAVLMGIYGVLSTTFTTQKDNFILLIVVSLISGFGNAFIIFILNEALNRKDSLTSGLALYFILGIIAYVFGQRIVRINLLKITNNYVYERRMELVNKILMSSYQKIEAIENGNIHSTLNNDTEKISGFANLIITAVTSLVTLISCFVYLGVINIYGLLISIFVILSATTLYYIVGRSANKLWEETRDIQNVFFKFINDLVNGFRELSINNKKLMEFKNDFNESCASYRDKRIIGDLKFANVFVIGELVFVLVIGTVAFVFPAVFKDIQSDTLRSYVFVYLYMTGPVNVLLNIIPNLIQIKISWRRINEFIKQISADKSIASTSIEIPTESINVSLNKVEYDYTLEEKTSTDKFSVGPIDLSFSSGQIYFITGGNGSGKTTLAKLITGLYSPTKGEILINGEKIEASILSQYYSVIFSDFYLFNKLYGVEYEKKEDDAEKYLKVLGLNDKVEIKDGEFSTIKLSSGQRKRLALFISYLEDKPIYLFDEWAADQDPEFRKYFYKVILPQLKSRGKCIIAITHDDRFFDVADKVIKMEFGKLVV